MRVTREIVAKEAGVTPTTVSCVLNNTRPVSEEVRNKVMQVIKKLNYVSDFSSRGILGKSTKQIVVVVDDILNPFFASMVKALEEKFSEEGYSLNISSEKNLDKNISVFLARRIDAVYFCSKIAEKDQSKLNMLVDNGITVVINPKIEFSGTKCTMDMDTKKAIKEGIEYLTGKGHKNIAFITNFDKDYKFDDREEAYIKEMQKRGLNPIVVRGEKEGQFPTIELGKELFEKAMKENPSLTAIFGLDDILALGAMMQAKDLGYDVPKDVSFIGIDGIYLSSLVSPKLTTFVCDMKSFGENVYKIITDALNNEIYSGYVQSLILTEGGSVSKIN